MIEVKHSRNTSNMTSSLLVEIKDRLFMKELPSEIISQIAESVAKRYVAEDYEEIIGKTDMRIIGDLVLKKITKEIMGPGGP